MSGVVAVHLNGRVALAADGNASFNGFREGTERPGKINALSDPALCGSVGSWRMNQIVRRHADRRGRTRPRASTRSAGPSA